MAACAATLCGSASSSRSSIVIIEGMSGFWDGQRFGQGSLSCFPVQWTTLELLRPGIPDRLDVV